jgi:hypothetical protein
MSRAVQQCEVKRTQCEDIPVDEFDFDPPTVEIPRETMRALMFGMEVAS